MRTWILLLYSLLNLVHTTSDPGSPTKPEQIPVLIAGGGASGTMAAIQCSRQGVRCMLVESTPWLGGMLTAAGVSAIDGNHNLPSGLWGAFRDSIYRHYGGPDQVASGWVSNTLFEPEVGNAILQKMVAAEPAIQLQLNATIDNVRFEQNRWLVQISTPEGILHVSAYIFIDATELGDWAASFGVPYRMGMDSRYITGEAFAPDSANDIIQDLTYVMTLKDYGPNANQTISPPVDYDPEQYRCSCSPSDKNPKPFIDCQQMLDYGKLPDGRYMINWPRCGNDCNVNVIESSPSERELALEKAKNKSLGFLYYLQTELGYSNLGLAGAYPTLDHLPLIPYYRESRRIHGLAFLTVNHLLKPFDQPEAYYRAGIAVGDYPIDHHHGERPDAPKIDFINIKVPSFNVPLGCLISQNVSQLIVAEKSISVSNIVNGASRLQPVVMEIGQAAGALAALSAKQQIPPALVPIRQVQQVLMNAGAYLMPYMDVNNKDPHFQAIQKAGATGLLKGHGVPFKWADQTWFYPDRLVSEFEFIDGIREYFPTLKHRYDASGEPLTIARFIELLDAIPLKIDINAIQNDWQKLKLSGTPVKETLLSRRMLAVLADHYLNLFAIPIDHQGRLAPSAPTD